MVVVVVVVVDGGDLTIDGCRPIGVGELTRWEFLDVGKIFCVGFNDEVDSWGFNSVGDDGLVDFNKDSEDVLVLFNDPAFVPLIDCFKRGFDDVEDLGDDGDECLGLLLLLDEVNVVNSVRIELADWFELVVLVTSLVFFLSLKPVINVAHPLVFFVVVPLVNEELELDIDGLLPVGLSNVVESDD